MQEPESDRSSKRTVNGCAFVIEKVFSQCIEFHKTCFIPYLYSTSRPARLHPICVRSEAPGQSSTVLTYLRTTIVSSQSTCWDFSVISIEDLPKQYLILHGGITKATIIDRDRQRDFFQ